MKRPKSHYRNMTPQKASEIRTLYFRGRLKQQEIADKYGIRQNTVSRIVSGQSWS